MSGLQGLTSYKGCCCNDDGAVYVAYACFDRRVAGGGTVGVASTLTANGATTESSNPPTGTNAIVSLSGAGGGRQTTGITGGAGAFFQNVVALPASSTYRIGKGGFGYANFTSPAIVQPFGGGIGARYTSGVNTSVQSGGGGATSWTGDGGSICAGGGGSGDENHLISGGPGGIATSVTMAGATAIDATGAGASPGVGGTGGGNGTTGVQATGVAGIGGTGSNQVSNLDGGGGGGGGFRAGGGGGTTGSGTGGGAGTGGMSVNYDTPSSPLPATAHAGGINGYAHVGKVFNDGAGIGNVSSGGDGGFSAEWRGCFQCECDEMPSDDLPPIDFFCLTQAQFDGILAACSKVDPSCNWWGPDNPNYATYIGFYWQGWPYTILRQGEGGGNAYPRPCERTVDGPFEEPRLSLEEDWCCSMITCEKQDQACTSCNQGPDVIYLCSEFATSLGIPECRPSIFGYFYALDYNGSRYKIFSKFDAQCFEVNPDESIEMLNVGTYSGLVQQITPPAGITVGPNCYSSGFTFGGSFSVNASGDCGGIVSEPIDPNYLDCNGSFYPGPLCVNTLDGIASGGFGIGCGGYQLEGKPGSCFGGTSSSCNASGNTANNYYSSGGCCNSSGAEPCCSGSNQCTVSCILQSGSNPNPSTYYNFITITRLYATNNTDWCTMGLTGTITIDGCNFDGDGNASHWSAAINANMNGCVTASAGTTPWGNLWLGTSAMCTCESGNLCSSGFHTGDNISILSITTTTCILVGQPASWFTLSGDILCTNNLCRFCDPSGGTVCRCCSSGYSKGDTFTGTSAEPDMYQYVAKPTNMGPFVASSSSGPKLGFS